MTEPAFTTALATLQSIYGGPEVKGMGSGVLDQPLPAGVPWESAAKQRYQQFCGDIWDRFGPDNWLGQWAEVYRRPEGQSGDIVRELRELKDHPTKLAGSMLLDNIDDPEPAVAALQDVFNHPSVQQLSIFRLGDGEAYSGLMIAAQSKATDRLVTLTLLMD
jgi:hypothetical protein